MSLAPEGRALCIGAAITAAVAWLLFPVWVALLCTAGAGFCVNFFRDPVRTPPADPDAIVSPADGRVVAVGDHEEPFLGEPARRISIFMNVFDVHVNRAPTDGVVDTVTHHPGRFVNAMAADASEHNEQTRITLAADRGKLVVTQIAGLVARRIICDLQPGATVPRGERIGLIRFGSRVDVVLPARCPLRVNVGDRVRAGESILGMWT